MIDWIYTVVAMTGVPLLIYVMQKTEHDRVNKFDPMPLQWFRRLAFIGSALALCYTVYDVDWNRSIPVVLLVGAADLLLSVNAVALHMRAFPDTGSKMRNQVYRPSRVPDHLR